MLNVLSWVYMSSYRSFRLHPYEDSVWEYNDSVWKATGEVWQEFNAPAPTLLHALTEIALNLRLKLVSLLTDLNTPPSVPMVGTPSNPCATRTTADFLVLVVDETRFS